MPFYSDIELVVRKSKTFEARLEREFGVTGPGLGAKITKAKNKNKLPPDTLTRLAEVRAIRDDIVHNQNINRLRNRREFLQLCNEIEGTLNKIAIRQRIAGSAGCLLIFGITAAIIIYSLLTNPS